MEKQDVLEWLESLKLSRPADLRRNLEAALSAAEDEPKSREWDLSITYTRCPPGHHFVDDEGHIAPNKKRAPPAEPPPDAKRRAPTRAFKMAMSNL